MKGVNLHKISSSVGTTIYWGQHIVHRSSYNGVTRFILAGKITSCFQWFI